MHATDKQVLSLQSPTKSTLNNNDGINLNGVPNEGIIAKLAKKPNQLIVCQ